MLAGATADAPVGSSHTPGVFGEPGATASTGGPGGVGTLIVAIMLGPAVANGSRAVELGDVAVGGRIRIAWATDRDSRLPPYVPRLA